MMLSDEFITLARELLAEDGVKITVTRKATSEIDPVDGGISAPALVGEPLGLLFLNTENIESNGAVITQTSQNFVLDNSVQIQIGDLLKIAGSSVVFTAKEVTTTMPQGVVIVYFVKVG